MFAATYPERTRALVLVNTPARAVKTEDYPYGLEPDAWREQLREVRQLWGERVYFEQQARRSNPSADDEFVDWFVTLGSMIWPLTLARPKSNKSQVNPCSDAYLPQILVRLHVEPHREQRELRAEDQQQRDEHDGAGRDGVALDPQHDLQDPEREPEQGHHEAEDVEEDERVEVADHVLRPQPPEEALQQQPGDRRHDLPQTDPGALADAVDRARRHIADTRVPDVQVDEHVVREPVALVELVEIEQLEILERDGGEAGLRVGDVPVARSDLRQHRQDRVAEVAVAGDQLPGLTGEEAVRLRVVELASRDRLDEMPQVLGVHLVVGGHHGGDVDPLLERRLVAGHDRRTAALVPLVLDHLNPRIGQRSRTLDRGVLGAVVDDEDPVDEIGHALDRRAEQLLLVVRGDHNRDPLAVEHGLKLHSGSADDPGPGLPEERRQDAEHEADEGPGEHRVATAARGRLRRPGGRDHLTLLDRLREREQLLVLRLVGDHLALLLHREPDLVREQESLHGREAAVALNGRLQRLDALVRALELRPVSGDQTFQRLDLLGDVDAGDLVDGDVGERVGGAGNLREIGR